tara:strand:- start:79 stop:264 length:186 start_codon:yes stop_codon:yes gene_type:complete
MTVKEMIKRLKELPQDLPIRCLEKSNSCDDIPNQWVCDIEFYEEGQSGYEISGEVILLTSE